MTQRQQQMISNYRGATATDLHGIYTIVSKKKLEAFDYCKSLMKEYNGKNLKVIGGNSYTFSAGFEFTDEDNNKCIMYITKGANTIIKVED